MRRSFLPIIVSLLFYASVFTQAGPQRTTTSCPRPIIESYPDSESRPVLRYLDESRQVADEFVRLLAEGKFDEIYSLNISVRIWVQAEPNVKMDLATFEQKQGKVTHYEYRNQHIVYDLRDPVLDLSGSVGTWYEVKTTKSEGGVASLLVETHRRRDDNRVTFEVIYFQELGRETVPAWLRYPYAWEGRDTCPGIKGRLRVKAP